jgi:hypothetical protein
MSSDFENDSRVKEAEEEIQKILLELEEEVGASIEYVDVDTHNFCQLRTSISLTTERKRM